MKIRKITSLALVFIMLLFGSLALNTNVKAQGETVSVNITVVSSGEDVLLPHEGTLGSKTAIDFGALAEKLDFFIQNGVIVDGTSAMQFTVSNSNNIIAVLEDATEVYIDTNGNYLGKTAPEEGTLSKPGLTHTGFVAHAIKPKVKVATYEVDATATTISVTINDVKSDYNFNDVVTATAPAKFSYWADAEGNLVSTKAEFKFTALKDTVLKAVYDENFTATNSVYLANVSGIREGHLSFLGQIDNKEGLIEYGVLASNTQEILTLDTIGITKMPSQALSPQDEFLRSVVDNGEFTTFRAYAIYNNETIYSENNFVIVNELEEAIIYETGFEDVTKSSYAAAEVTINDYIWNLDDSLVDSLAADKKNGTNSVRLRGLMESKSIFDNITKVVFYAANYGTNTGGKIKVEVSSDGTIWEIAGEEVTLTADLVEYTFDVTKAGPLYVKITKTAGDRTNIDDLRIYGLVTPLTDAEKIAETKAELEVGLLDNTSLLEVTSNLELPVLGLHDATITWASSNEAVLSTLGVVTPSAVDETITLTATITLGELTETKEFTVKVIGIPVYTVTINYGYEIADDVLEYTENDAFTLPADPVREGFIFTGWFIDAEYTTPATDLEAVNESFTIYAKWADEAAETVLVTFDTDGGNVIDPVSVVKGEILTLPAEPTKAGFTFVGWFTDVELTVAFVETKAINTDLTLYAKWIEDVQEPVTATIVAEGTSISTAIPEGDITSYFTITNPGDALFAVNLIHGTAQTKSIFHNSAGETRLYKGITLEISVPTGYIIRNVKITTSRNNGAVINGASSITDLTMDVAVSDLTSITIYAEGKQVRISSIEITYLPQ